jgi:cyclic 2,3-diphosphoglycerate synthetase
VKVLAVIDGEHYEPVVRDALSALPYEVVAVWLAGGTEKLRGGEDYGAPVVSGLEAGIAEHEPEFVIDLSDEPVLGPPERFRVASRVLASGLPYVGPDFRFDPPELAPFQLPSLAVIGTGKRVGKTAVTGHVARLFARDRDVVVVAMGRGGPSEPEVAEVRPTLEDLLRLSREGRHAASDHLETAALTGVVTIGCRRCGGGLAGSPGESNVLAGAALAAEREPDLVIFDGSGAAIPPVDTGARVLVTSSAQPVDVATGYLNAYRILISDLVLVTGGADERLRGAIAEVKDVPVVPFELRPRPAVPVAGRRVAFFSTAPAEVHETLKRHLAEQHGAEVIHVSGNLARREALRAELDQVDAEVYLVEIKAAAIDVVAEAALEHGREIAFADNELVSEADLDGHLLQLSKEPRRRLRRLYQAGRALLARPSEMTGRTEGIHASEVGR